MIDPTEIRSIGRYQVVRFLAEGGFAWVFEVLDPILGCHRALKMLKRVDSRQDAARFRREVEQLAKLNDPYIVQIFDVGEDEATGCPFFTMTLVEGPTLRDRLLEARERGGGLSLREVVDIFGCVLAGLAHLHARGITHRDVTPSNILLTLDHRALLSDLGIARPDDSELTHTGVTMGTALYMSPEQAGAKRVGPTTDVFSAGLCLYQALEGRTVYETVDDLEVSSGQAVMMHLGAIVDRQEDLRLQFTDATPQPLRPVVERACRTDALERYPDGAAMLEAFREAWEQVARDTRRGGIKRWRVAAAALGVVGVLAAGWSVWVREYGAPSPAPNPPGPGGEAPAAVLEAVVLSLSSPRGASPVFAPDDLLEISIRTSRDAYVRCFYGDAGGRIFRIFPNPWQKDARVTAGSTVDVPAAGADFHIALDAPGSREEVVCLASDRDLGGMLPAELEAEELAPLGARSTEAVIAAFRKVAGTDLGVARMPITVSPR